VGCGVLSKDGVPRGRRPSGILSCEGRCVPWDTSVHCLTVLEHGHTHEEFRFCLQIVFFHFNFLVLTLKSRCYFVYDIFAIVRMPLRCNVLECFTAWLIAIGV